MLAYFVPKEQAVILGNWDVMGLAGTASVDYEIPEQVIDADWTFSLLSAEPLRGGPVYRLGVLSLTSIGHAAFALGVGQRAMEEITAIASGKARLGALSIRDQQLFRHDYALHDAAMQAAASWTSDVFGQAQAVVDAGSMPDAVLASRLRQATTWSIRVATDAVRFATSSSTTTR